MVTGQGLGSGTPAVSAAEAAGSTVTAEGHGEGDHWVHSRWAAGEPNGGEAQLMVGAHPLGHGRQDDRQHPLHAGAVAGADAGGESDTDRAGLLLSRQGGVDGLAQRPQWPPGSPHPGHAQQQPQQQSLGQGQCLRASQSPHPTPRALHAHVQGPSSCACHLPFKDCPSPGTPDTPRPQAPPAALLPLAGLLFSPHPSRKRPPSPDPRTLPLPPSCFLDGVSRGPTDLPGTSPSLVPPLLCLPGLIPAGCGGGKAAGGGSMVG